jgi:hypothetical protein
MFFSEVDVSGHFFMFETQGEDTVRTWLQLSSLLMHDYCQEQTKPWCAALNRVILFAKQKKT